MTPAQQQRPSFAEERRELETVLHSRTMLRGPNISKILAYVCEKYFEGEVDTIREYNIAVDALGRKATFDPATDSIVRVEVSRLRRRLREYYAGEGSGHEMRIQLPETGYVPQFVRADVATPEPLVTAIPEAAPQRRIDRFAVLLGLLALCLAVCAWLAWQNAQLRASLPKSSTTPTLDRFWSQFFGDGRRTVIVTSDANAMILGDLLKRPVSAHEYRSSSYPRSLLEGRIQDPEFLRFTTRFLSTFLTNTADAVAASDLRQIAGRLGANSGVVFARDFRHLPGAEENLILLGHKKANPAVELYEDRMNFVYSWDPEKRKGLLRNRRPVQGEKEAYPVEQERSFSTIRFIDGGSERGNLLLIGGNDMAGVELGARFLTSEQNLHLLYRRLKIAPDSKVPSFELLLAAKRVLNLSYEPEIVAWRSGS